MEEKCICCKTGQIYVQKRKLCKKCYLKIRQGNIIKGTPWISKTKIFHATEIEFVKNYFDHKEWIYQPAVFRLNGVNYSPDFYDARRNVFIEVAGTHQAFYRNLKKYRDMNALFPKIEFEVRDKMGKVIKL